MWKKGVDNPTLECDPDDTTSKNHKSEALELKPCESNGALESKADTQIAVEAEEAVEEDNGDQQGNALGRVVETIRSGIIQWVVKHQKTVAIFIRILAVLLFFGYFGAAVWYSTTKDGTGLDWENGVGMLIILTSIGCLGVLYFVVLKGMFGKPIRKHFLKPYIGRPVDKLMSIRIKEAEPVPWILFAIVLAGFLAFLILDAGKDTYRLRSLIGVVVFVLMGFMFSTHPGKIRWRQVLWGLSLQFIFALLTLRWETGKQILSAVGNKVTTFFNFTDKGTQLVYGVLVNDTFNIFAFRSLPVIFFFSFCIQILYYYGTMQWVIKKISWLLQITMQTTACESMNAAANIFIGQTEAPILIKPYLALMTKSEIHAVMTGGFATIAGTVMASYINFGIDASHLLTASIMGAPAALAMSKLWFPETEKSRTRIQDIKMTRGSEANVLDAAAQGASTAIMLILNIIANIIAFLAFIAFMNSLVSWLGGLVGASYLSFEWILAKIFIPFAWLLGVPNDECDQVALLLGLKSVANEFIAYQQLAQWQKSNILSERAEAIATYALCGFANPGSVGIQLGGMSAMCPERKSDFASIVLRAFVAGTFACFLNACIAGTLIP